MKDNKTTTASDRYLELASLRQQTLDMARECSELTIQYVMPRAGHSKDQRFPSQYQSVGGSGVKAMAAKLGLALVPPTTSFFKLQINDGEFTKNPELDAKIKTEADLVLARQERIINQHISASQDRVVFGMAFIHLIITGNILCFLPDKEPMKLFPLDRYVVSRGDGDAVTEILTVEAVSQESLPEKVKEEMMKQANGPLGTSGTTDVHLNEDEVEVFTWAKLEKNMWRWHQEVDGVKIPGTEGQAKKEVTPWLIPRFERVAGDDYGRGHVETYRGDLRSLESLTKSLVEGSAAMAKFVWLVSPSASCTPQDLAKSKNQAILQGRPDDVSVVQANKAQDLAVPQSQIQTYTQALSQAFLMFNPRDSERTTAEEIRATQQELTERLGGTLGNLTVEFLQPYLARKMYVLQKDGQLPKIPEGLVMPTIVTGLDGVGRGQDVQALGLYFQTIQQTFGPEALSQYVNVLEGFRRLAAGAGIDALGLVKTQEEIQQEQQASAQQEQQLALTGQAAGLAQAQVEATKVQNDAAQADPNQQQQEGA